MTREELTQLRDLKQEIAMDRRRLRELELRALPGGLSLTGLPGTCGPTDRVGDYAAEIADLRAVIEDKYRRCLAELGRLERYIAGIEDSLTRQAFTDRFVYGLPWGQVAMRMGGGNTSDGVRMMCYRYLKRRE